MFTSIMEMSRHFQKSYRAYTALFTGGIGLIVLSSAFYGLTTVVTKGILESLSPITLLTVQTASSVVFFWTIVILRKVRVPLTRDTLKIGLAGLLEPGLSYLFAIFGLSLTTASNATFIGTMEPIFTIGLSWFFLKEKIGKTTIVLGTIACSGVALISSTAQVSGEKSSLWGDSLLLLNVLFASLHALTTARSIRYLAPVAIAALQQTFALILFSFVLAITMLSGVETIGINDATGFPFLVAILSGAFGYGIAFLLYLAALKHGSAGKISVYLTLIPIFGVIGAYILLGERFSPSQGLGGSLILLSIVGISRLPDREEKEIVPT